MNASQWRRYVFREKYLTDRQVRDIEEPQKEGQSIKKRGVSGQRDSVTLPHISPVACGICSFAAYSMEACRVIGPR
jgi:hypothetical protein